LYILFSTKYNTVRNQIKQKNNRIEKVNPFTLRIRKTIKIQYNTHKKEVNNVCLNLNFGNHKENLSFILESMFIIS